MDKSDCLLVGTLSKLHSFKGLYVLISDSVLHEEIENWESVFLEIEGLLVPFFIDHITITSDTSAIIGFEDINSDEKAREFVSCQVFQLQTIIGDIEEEVDESLNSLVGYYVTDKKAGTIGVIDALLNYNDNLLFRIVKNGNELLLPVSDESIVKINHKKKEILMTLPEGLLDLYA